MTTGVILSLGSVNADFQVRVERRPEISETLLAHDFAQLGGGKAANVAYIARRLGAPARLIAHVGRDTLAEQALAPLRQAGVDLAYVREVDGPTGVSMITVPPDGQKGIVLAGNANDRWAGGDADAVRAAIADAPDGSVLVVDYEVPPFIVAAAVRAARSRGLAIVLDPSPTDRHNPRLLPLISYLTPDASEAQKIAGHPTDTPEQAAAAARRLVEQGAATACVKLSDGGCVMVSRSLTFYVPPVPVEVVDSTGAGDAFTGALAVAVLEGQSPREIASFATAASHVTVTRYGSQPAYPSREELRDFERQLSEQAHELD